MKNPLLALLLLASISYSQNQEQDRYWKFFQPEKTTEQDVILIFGTPDIVDVQFTYDDLKKAKQSNNKIDIEGYELQYTGSRGELNILKGPLGEASLVKVTVENGKVYFVEWEYDGRNKAPADEAWANDKSFGRRKSGPGITGTLGTKTLPNGIVLLISCDSGPSNSCNGTITVRMFHSSDNR